MDEREWLAQRFQEHRPRLRALAYRMLGSTSEADDALQEAWIRLSRSNEGEIDNLGGWLTTVVARVALNMLRSRKTRREQPLEAHLPDPIVDRAEGIDLEHEALLADSVSCMAGRARDADPRRAPRLRPARHVLSSLRGDRRHPGALPPGGAPTGQPRPPPHPLCAHHPT